MKIKFFTFAKFSFFFGLALCATPVMAQQMPQDNWRYDQQQIFGPNPGQPLRSIAIGPGGVYIGGGDPATSILRFQENSVPLGTFGSFGAIRGIACDSAGNVYVLDAGDSMVKVFDQSGNPLRQWGGPGTNDGQFSLTVDATTLVAIGPGGEVFVADPGNTRVQVFNSQGTLLRKWGSPGTLPGQFPANTPQAIVVGPDGRVYANIPNTVIFDGVGGFLRILNSPDGFPVGWGGNPMTVSKDGILFATVQLCGPFNCTYELKFIDANTASNSIVFPSILTANFSYYLPRSAAFNSRGDLYLVNGNSSQPYGTSVQIYMREYSSVQNPPTPPAIPEPVVLAVSQRTNTAWLDVDYQVTDADSTNVMTGSLAFVNGANTLSAVVSMYTFMEGTATNLGPNIPANTRRRFTWNMGADWSIDFAQIQVEVLAKDERNLLGFHWITVPADGTNAAVQISSTPVLDTELQNLWYWFIATHNSGITLTNGAVMGAGGAYDGQLLANDSGSTPAGRDFACGQMHVRAITGLEINRANMGNYGFGSVTTNSMVKLP